VESRNEEIGVIGLDLEGLNVDCTWTRGLDTEEGIVAFVRAPLVVDLVVRGGLRADSSCCRSLARRRVSFVLPERLDEGVCGGMAFAVGGVVKRLSSCAVPKLIVSES
jgi:hypothetical protein